MLPRLLKAKAALAGVMIMAATGTCAEDAALYDEAAPSDAVFVRILSSSDAHPLQVVFAGTQLTINNDLTDTYIPISAADLNGARAGGYYSLVDGPVGTLTIEEPARDSAAKVHLLLLNAGPEAVRLIAPSKELEVLAALEPGQVSSRAVNPIEIDLAVQRISDGAVLGVFDVRLSRGQNVTFVAEETSARLIENSFGPTLKLN